MHKFYPSKQLLQVTIALLSLTGFIVLGWAGREIIRQPDLGALWTGTGVIYFASNSSGLLTGDRIVTIDKVQLSKSDFPYYMWNEGDTIHLEVERQGEKIFLALPYSDRAPFVILISRLMLLMVAATFLGVSSWVALFSATTRQSVLFFFCCQALSLSLAMGSVTSQAWSADISLMATWWAVAFALHFHLLFPMRRITSNNRALLLVIYIIPLLGFLRLVTITYLGWLSLLSSFYAPLFYTWVLVGLTGILWLLISSYQRAPTAIVKHQVGLVALSGFLALVPLLTLTILPEIFFGGGILPTEVAFLFLIASPIGYGYAITQYQIIKLEKYISRSATTIIVICLMALLYYGVSAILALTINETIVGRPLLNLAVIVILVLTYHPIAKRLQQWLDHIIYGGWYDYSSVVGEVTHSLIKTDNVQLLGESLCHSVQNTMRVLWTSLLLEGESGADSMTFVSGQPENHDQFESLELVDLAQIRAFFQIHSRPITNSTLRQAIIGQPLSQIEEQALQFNSIQVWVPFHGLQGSMGLLILGPKFGGDPFNDVDLEILRAVAQQVGIAYQNVQLIEELEAKVYENELYQKQVNRVREEERKRISRELHDQVIQVLVGLKYQVAHVLQRVIQEDSLKGDPHTESGLQEEINELIHITRTLCNDLRPPALDLGLVPTIRSTVHHFEMVNGIEVTLTIEGDRETSMSEDISLCLYRITNEALANIRKHAKAAHAEVSLILCDERVRLTISDNGFGFDVPDRLGSLMKHNHFGLVGMRERVELVNGTFAIDSHPEQGTCLRVSIPLLATPI